MAIEHIEATALWKKSLSAREDDVDAKYRDRLRSALLTMRENVIPFVRNIHRDVLGLTVHEESHLDALWQTANCISGDDFDITPIEAFVFGASVLLHDTGLAVAAYPGGLAELSETTAWRDNEAGILSRRTPSSNEPLNDNEKKAVLFATLRGLHAEQAEKLISFTFKRPGREEAIPLLQDVGLHDALGTAIGRIAHSHHWNSADLVSKLVTVAGTVPGFPTDWTLNELKVACLLRCADAAHIDSLRAPTMLFAITNVEGVSADHWKFQNKLNTVTRSKDKLLFYAGKPFGVDEASSWWLAYDTMQMIDCEIKSCNAILEETGALQFAASGVHGIESPRLLSKTVRVEGWTPVDAEVKVSDPVHLARTLGGRNLYGSGAIAPVRELLQNAVDAVRARRAHQSRDNNWGKIRLIIECPDNDSSDVWLHVDDTGTGMSERVVTGPLIDFGKSFWSSTLLDEEFPGLRSSAPKLVGKFGIGFFSIFLLGDAVRVVTRRFDASDSSAIVLNFDELTRRPLLRRAATGELPLDYTTRVSVKLNDYALSQMKPQRLSPSKAAPEVSFVALVRYLIAAVDVDVEIIDRVNGQTGKHSGQWLNNSPKEFLEDVCSLKEQNNAINIIESHQDRVRLITEPDGTIVGRAALLLSGKQEDHACVISVGGFTSQLSQFDRYTGFDDVSEGIFASAIKSILGVVIGDTYDASRARATIAASREAITSWAQEQDNLIDVSQFTSPKLVSICHLLLMLGAESAKMPFGFLGGRFSTVDEFRLAIADSAFVDIPLSFHEYLNKIEFREINDLNTPYFTSRLHSTVAVVVSARDYGDFLSEEDRREIVKKGSYKLNESQINSVFRNYSLRYLSDLTRECWGDEISFSVERVDLTSVEMPTSQLYSWSLRISRDRNSGR